LHAGGDIDAALADARASIARRPTCHVSFAVAGSVHRYLGAWEAAVEACQHAMQLSPMTKPWYSTVLASAYYVGERYHEAAEAAVQIIHRYPDSTDPEILLILAASQQALGLPRRARATAKAGIGFPRCAAVPAPPVPRSGHP
jgi:tetratricopeptide (TPR) repeat protein